MVKNLPVTQETWVQSLGQEDPLEKGMALQYSCLENPMDRGVWQAIVSGIAKSQTTERLTLLLTPLVQADSVSSEPPGKPIYMQNFT